MQPAAAKSSEHRVRDIMTTPVHSVDMDDSILEIKNLFEREGCHHVVILKDRHVQGVVSDRDILNVLSPFVGSKLMERTQDLNTLHKRVHQIMSRNPVTIGPAEAITAAGDKMLQERVSCLPVVDDRERVVGIVTVRDFVKWSVGESHAREVESKHGEQGQGILIIIDGRRCYSPDAELSRLIRETEKLHNATEGFDSAQVPLLHTVSSN